MLAVASLAALALLADPLELSAGVTAEVRVGQTPIVPGEDPKFAQGALLTPAVALDARSRELTLHLDYGLRLYGQHPHADGDKDILMLNVANLRLIALPSRISSVTASASAQLGATDYAFLTQTVLNQATMAPQTQSRTPEFLSLTGTVTGLLRASGRLTLQLKTDGTYREPRNVPPATTTSDMMSTPLISVFSFPRQSALLVTPGITYALTRQDDLTFSTAFGYQSTSSDVTTKPMMGDPTTTTLNLSVFYVAPRVTWRRRLTPETDLGLSGGVAWSDYLAGSVRPTNASPWTGLGSAELSSRLLQRHDVGLTARGSLMVDYFVDPILGIAGPRGSAGGGLAAVLPPDWALGLDLFFGTNLTAPQLPPQSMQGASIPNVSTLDVTVASVTAWSRRRLSDNALAELGIRWSDRAPYLGGVSAPTFGFHQRQLWVYVGFTATTRPQPRWSP